ncbi:uncharacterized protein YjiS (DUF1127 family) [Rhodobium orientis]|nr:DUF1127 domain-containing protein [Rhodobium orientis]MBB4304128.1 uncharacterized protein YjiS (DUF1127 family) [Rhodobium orientis]
MTTELRSSSFLSRLADTSASALTALGAYAVRRWRIHRNRREVRQLLDWNAHSLKDIGLTPMDVRLAASMPGSVDSSTRLRILAVERRAGERAQARERMAEMRRLEAAARRTVETDSQRPETTAC